MNSDYLDPENFPGSTFATSDLDKCFKQAEKCLNQAIHSQELCTPSAQNSVNSAVISCLEQILCYLEILQEQK